MKKSSENPNILDKPPDDSLIQNETSSENPNILIKPPDKKVSKIYLP